MAVFFHIEQEKTKLRDSLSGWDKINDYLPDSFLLNKPKDILSIYFFWFEHINGCSYLAVADYTLHGASGIMVSLVCSNALFRSAIEFNIYEPLKILNKTRELVIETFSKKNKDIKEVMDIALLKLGGTKLTYTGAYNPLWIIRDIDNL